MSTMKEPLVTLSLIVVMLVYEINPTQLRFLFSSVPEKSCTSMKDMDSNQWFTFLFYHHVHKRHLAYNIFSILWKGILLEGCLGSRQFSLLILALLFTYDGLLISTRLLCELLAGAEICLPICHTGISGLLFSLTFPLNTNSEIYRSIIPAPCQNLYTVILSAIYALEIAILYSLCPGLSFYGPVCGTLAGLVYSYQPQLFSHWNSYFLNRWWLRPVRKISGVRDSHQLPETIQMVWSCSACTYDNSITHNPYACYICETPRFKIIESPDKAGLVWNCPTCTYENGVFFNGCEICQTSRPVSA